MSLLAPSSISASHLNLSSLELFHTYLPRPKGEFSSKAAVRRNKGTRCGMCNDHVRKRKNAAAFFDVDGTISGTNVVAAYFCSRIREIPIAVRLFWIPWFALSCIVYLIVDRMDRTAFNHLFYSMSFKDRSIVDKKDIARIIYESYYRPRTFGGAVELIQVLKKQGYHIVLITGCLDFLIAPLARDLGVDFVYASELVEEGGRFTGEVRGAGATHSQKAQCVLSYARAHQLCLSSSLAFGDCIADLCMLETVGSPHAVNPDGRLKSVAASRGWPIIEWKLKRGTEPFNFGWLSSIFSKPEISTAKEATYA